MEKIPDNAQIESEIVDRIIGRREGFVLHKGLIDVLTFYIEKHPFDPHIEINVCNRLSTNRVRVGSGQNIFVQYWRIFSGIEFCEVVQLDTDLHFSRFFEGWRLVEQIDPSNEIRHWQKCLIAQGFLEKNFSVQVEFAIFHGAFSTNLGNIEC